MQTGRGGGREASRNSRSGPVVVNSLVKMKLFPNFTRGESPELSILLKKYVNWWLCFCFSPSGLSPWTVFRKEQGPK